MNDFIFFNDPHPLFSKIHHEQLCKLNKTIALFYKSEVDIHKAKDLPNNREQKTNQT